MKTRLLIIIVAVSVFGILIFTSGMFTPLYSNTEECYYVDSDDTNEIKHPCKIIDGWYDVLFEPEPSHTNANLEYEHHLQECANSYNFMQTKITQIRQTDFLSVSDYVQDIDTLLEIKKDIQRLDCESTAYQWIHLATNTQKISDPSEIVIQRTYDNVRTITNNQLVIPQYVVPWKILDYLQQHGIEFTNAPSNNAIQTDEGWRDPTRLCSQLLFTNGTQFYASATFHPDPLSVTGIFVDLERPTDCQKYFPIPRGFQ